MTVFYSRVEFSAAAKLFDQFAAECLRFLFSVNVCDGSHQGTNDDLCVIREKVDLKTGKKVFKVSLEAWFNKCYYYYYYKG